MLKKVAKPLTTLVKRYLPDPFIFVTLLTFVITSVVTPSAHKK
ncbi:TIGR00366 family protein [Pseudoalteromonas sp. SG45-5]|nr:TIGR00366 family protein [Pseudoalteromonas sp. SG45-5]MBB1395118.1 TIGR00366 family protein [Pseudoalteromonas sp. SG44-4]MBB1447018.1 TIGR00366 family protein [Pseudoalteromonas sp. SG41-6]